MRARRRVYGQVSLPKIWTIQVLSKTSRRSGGRLSGMRDSRNLTPCEMFTQSGPEPSDTARYCPRCCLPPRQASRPKTLTADQIARHVQDRDTGRDSRAKHAHEAVRPPRPRPRAGPDPASRSAAARRPARRPAAPDGDRLLIRFTYPNDIRGTAFLVWEHPQGDDERFLYLPSLGRVRRIAGSEAQESFVGSDFSYEDIGGRELEDYTYALVDENAAWTAPDGARRPAYRLESRRKDRVRRVPARRLARPQGQLRRRPGRRLQPARTRSRRSTR